MTKIDWNRPLRRIEDDMLVIKVEPNSGSASYVKKVFFRDGTEDNYTNNGQYFKDRPSDYDLENR